MKMMMKTMVAAVGIAAALTASAMTEAIAYYGNIQNADGTPFERPQQMAMTFRIYDSMNPQTVLWARTIPVRVEIDGSFYAELSDEKGEVPKSGAVPQDRPLLARVCANAEGNIQIGLTPPGSAEFSPRQTLSAYPAADYAAYAKGAPKATFTKPLVTDTVIVKGKATVVGDLTVGFSDSELMRKPIDIDLEAGKETTLTGKEIVFVNGVKGWATVGRDWAGKGPDRIIMKSSRRRGIPQRGYGYSVRVMSSEVKGYNETMDDDDVVWVRSVQAF